MDEVSLNLWYHIPLYPLQNRDYRKALRGYQKTTYIYFLNIGHYLPDILLNHFSKTVVEDTRLLLVKYLQHVDHNWSNFCRVLVDHLWHSDPLILARGPDPVRLIIKFGVDQDAQKFVHRDV